MERAASKRENPIKSAWRWGKKAWGVLAERKFTTLAGTLVFFLVISIMPFLFWITLLGGGAALKALEELELFGWAEEIISFFRTSAEEATAGASVLFLATTLWSSTGFFYHLRRSGELIYDYRREKKGWRVRLSAALFTLGISLFLAVTGGLFGGALYFLRFLPEWANLFITYFMILLFGFLICWALNLYVCPYRCSPLKTVWGSFFTALAWLVSSALFLVYLHFSSPEKLYGALSVLLVFLLWLYWMMVCFVTGAVFNSYRVKQGSLEHKTL